MCLYFLNSGLLILKVVILERPSFTLAKVVKIWNGPDVLHHVRMCVGQSKAGALLMCISVVIVEHDKLRCCNCACVQTDLIDIVALEVS